MEWTTHQQSTHSLTHNTLSLFLLPTPTPHPYLQSDEEEPVCQKPIIEEHCEKHHCESAVEKYKACQERVTAKGSGSCEGYAFDLWHCIDHCVSRMLFFYCSELLGFYFFFLIFLSVRGKKEEKKNILLCLTSHPLAILFNVCLLPIFFPFTTTSFSFFQAQSQIFTNLK